MAFVDLQPPSKSDRISISQHKKSGKVTVTLSGECAVRNKIRKGTALRVQIDLDSEFRQLRLVVDPKGPFSAIGRIGNSVSITLPKLAKLPLLEEKAVCEFDENPQVGSIDIGLPPVWQPRKTEVPAIAGQRGPSALAPRRTIHA